MPSLQRGLGDELMRRRGRIPKHCRRCGKRFFILDPAAAGDDAQGAGPADQSLKLEAPRGTRCPRCGSADIVGSLPRNLWDELMRGFGRIPKHCRGCGKRFFVPDPARLPAREQ